MVATLRFPTIAVVLSLGLVGCGMSSQSSSTGAAPAASAQTAQSGYIVPPGYVSGQKVLPYAGRIQSKCEHHVSDAARTACIATER